MQTFAKTHTAVVILCINKEVLPTGFLFRSAADPCDYQCHRLVQKHTQIQPCRNGRMKKHKISQSSLPAQFLLFSTAFYKQLFILQIIKKLNILVAISEKEG